MTLGFLHLQGSICPGLLPLHPWLGISLVTCLGRGSCSLPFRVALRWLCTSMIGCCFIFLSTFAIYIGQFCIRYPGWELGPSSLPGIMKYPDLVLVSYVPLRFHHAHITICGGVPGIAPVSSFAGERFFGYVAVSALCPFHLPGFCHGTPGRDVLRLRFRPPVSVRPSRDQCLVFLLLALRSTSLHRGKCLSSFVMLALFLISTFFRGIFGP